MRGRAILVDLLFVAAMLSCAANGRALAQSEYRQHPQQLQGEEQRKGDKVAPQQQQPPKKNLNELMRDLQNNIHEMEVVSETADKIKNISSLYSLKKYQEAEVLIKHIISIYENKLGKEHLRTLHGVMLLSELYLTMERYSETLPLYERVLVGRERALGPDHIDTAKAIYGVGKAYAGMRRYAEAEQYYMRALKAFDALLSPTAMEVGWCLTSMLPVYINQGRYADAVPIAKRLWQAKEAVNGKDDAATLTLLTQVAHLETVAGQYAEAEVHYKQLLAAQERLHGKDHPDTLNATNALATLYRLQGRGDEAGKISARTAETGTQTLGEDHPSTLTSLQQVALEHFLAKRYSEAELIYRRIAAAKERTLGKDHRETLTAVGDLATAVGALGRYAEAENLMKEAVARAERSFGRDDQYARVARGKLGFIYRLQGRLAEAEPLIRENVEMLEEMVGKTSPALGVVLGQFAEILFEQNDWNRAVGTLRRSTSILGQHARRSLQDAGQEASDAQKSENWQTSLIYSKLVKAIYRLTPEGQPDSEALTREVFEAAQWAHNSETAGSLTQMAVRSAAGNAKLAELLRERQDLVGAWRKLNDAHTTRLTQGGKQAQFQDDTLTRLTEIDARIVAIDERFGAEFPNYMSLINPAPLSVSDAQSLLREDEALVLILDTPEAKPTPSESFIWVVTPKSVRWTHASLGGESLASEVRALRCGLDASTWETADCARLLNIDFSLQDVNAGKPLPFDYARAHNLYKTLFGGVEDLIAGKHLLIVSSGALTQMPFHVLTTAPHGGGGKDAPWLIRKHAITVLPAVSSLRALRRVAHSSGAAKPLIGFGNPLLLGDQSNPKYGAYYKKRAQAAREAQSCGGEREGAAPAASLRRGVASMTVQRGLTKTADLLVQTPLPETAGELCSVARTLKAEPSEIRLGARATETEIKRLSANGELANYRVIHFATHGALAGDLSGVTEPGLILTPPAVATLEDDGYFSASEIAAQKLDADLVILSACNTAAGDTTGAQALSGLARAFFYAQARSLLVSHWPVDSEATVKLVTTMMEELTRSPHTGRAESLRRAMLSLIDSGKARESHPAFWAPFIVVGEGAR